MPRTAVRVATAVIPVGSATTHIPAMAVPVGTGLKMVMEETGDKVARRCRVLARMEVREVPVALVVGKAMEAMVVKVEKVMGMPLGVQAVPVETAVQTGGQEAQAVTVEHPILALEVLAVQEETVGQEILAPVGMEVRAELVAHPGPAPEVPAATAGMQAERTQGMLAAQVAMVAEGGHQTLVPVETVAMGAQVEQVPVVAMAALAAMDRVLAATVATARMMGGWVDQEAAGTRPATPARMTDIALRSSLTEG